MKKSTIFLIILAAVFFTSTLVLLYQNQIKNPSVTLTSQTGLTPTTTPTDPTADWKTYTNEQSSLSFKYPSLNWNISENNGAITLVLKTDQNFDLMITTSNKEFDISKLSSNSIQNTILGNIPAKKLSYLTPYEQKQIYYSFSHGTNFFTLLYKESLDSQINQETNQILSTFKFTTTVSSPTPAASVNKVKILDTSSWVEYSCSSISYKLPSNYNQKCNLAFNGVEGTDEVLYGENGKYGGSSIMIKKYDGGSRRQNWIDTMQATPSEISKYVRFQESLFETVSGLDVFASGGWWQGGYSSPILIAQGKTIVYLFGGRDFNEVTGKITRWDISDTIASTIRFLN